MLQQTLKSWTMSLTESFPAAKVKREGKKGFSSSPYFMYVRKKRNISLPWNSRLYDMNLHFWTLRNTMVWWMLQKHYPLSCLLHLSLINAGENIKLQLTKETFWGGFYYTSGNNTSEPSWACRIWRDLTTMCWFFLPKKNSFTWPEAQGSDFRDNAHCVRNGLSPGAITSLLPCRRMNT